MIIGKLNLVAGVLVGLLGLIVAAAGPALAPAFGVADLPPVGGSVEVPPEWRLVAFVRMFGIAVFLSGAILFVVGKHVAGERVRIFAGVIAGASAVACLFSVIQQSAIWNTAAGAAVASVFGGLALAYGWLAVRGEVAGPKVVHRDSSVAAQNVS